MGFIASLDPYSKPKDIPKTFIGGIISIITYILVAILLIVYTVSVSDAEYPREVSVVAFPAESTSSILMPPMNCIATSGCYIRSAGAPSTCMFVGSGVAIPDSIRTIQYTSDAYEYFSVLSTDSGENFAVSYDVNKVTSYKNPIGTSTITAATDSTLTTPMPYKMFRGISMFNLIRTVGIDETVDTWGHSTTSATSMYDSQTGINCCGSVVYDTDGTTVLYAAGSGPLSSCSANDGKWTTSIQASTTYTEVTIIDPLEFATLAGLIGGWLGIMATVGMILFIIYT